MDIGDIIYLVLALLLGLLSVLRKKKVQEEAEEMPYDEKEAQPRKQPNPLDEIFRDFAPYEEEPEISLEEKEAAPPAPEPEPKATNQANQYLAPTFEEYLKKTNQNNIPIAHKISLKGKEEERKKDISKKSHPIKAEFDLRKAVVYSEILNRKY